VKDKLYVLASISKIFIAKLSDGKRISTSIHEKLYETIKCDFSDTMEYMNELIEAKEDRTENG
jgi:hypothetical protein